MKRMVPRAFALLLLLPVLVGLCVGQDEAPKEAARPANELYPGLDFTKGAEDDPMASIYDDLSSGDPERESNALRALWCFFRRPIGKKLVEVLPGLKTARERGTAIEVLASMGNDNALPVILKMAADKKEDEWVREQAFAALAAFDARECIPIVRNVGSDKEESVATRVAAIWLLGWLKDSGSIPLLNELLKSDERDLRMAAIEQMGVIGDRSVVAVLLKMAEDETDPMLVEELGCALARFKEKEALPLLFRSSIGGRVEGAITDLVGRPIEPNLEFPKTIDAWRRWWEESRNRLVWDARRQLYVVPGPADKK